MAQAALSRPIGRLSESSEDDDAEDSGQVKDWDGRERNHEELKVEENGDVKGVLEVPVAFCNGDDDSESNGIASATEALVQTRSPEVSPRREISRDENINSRSRSRSNSAGSSHLAKSKGRLSPNNSARRSRSKSTSPRQRGSPSQGRSRSRSPSRSNSRSSSSSKSRSSSSSSSEDSRLQSSASEGSATSSR